MAKQHKTKVMCFNLYTYDLWADGEGGMTVNDVYGQGKVEVRARRHDYNVGTEHESHGYTLTDRQLNRAVGGQGLTWEGEVDPVLYATDRKGNPACELRRVMGE